MLSMAIDIILIVELGYVWAGNKKSNIDIVYTPWSNLNKAHEMVVGAVSAALLEQWRHVQAIIRPWPISVACLDDVLYFLFFSEMCVVTND